VVKLPSETKNTKLSFAHFDDDWAKIIVKQKAPEISLRNFEFYLCVNLLSGGY
jgi:hypothetical protein